MKEVNFMKCADSLEDLILMKGDIERKQISEGLIKDKLPLDQFFAQLVMQTAMYYDNGTVIPFRFVEGEKEQYMIYTYDMSDKNAFKNFQSRMKTLKYNTEGLTKIEMKDLLGMNFEKEKFFLINGEYYK